MKGKIDETEMKHVLWIYKYNHPRDMTTPTNQNPQDMKTLVDQSKIKACFSCESSPIDDKFTKDILFNTCTFCSGWCQRDYEYDVRKGQRLKNSHLPSVQFQQNMKDIENQNTNDGRAQFWNVKLDRESAEDRSTAILRKYFKAPEHPWNSSPTMQFEKAVKDIENQKSEQFWNVKLKESPNPSPQVDRSIAVLSKYFTDPNEPWNYC